MPKVALTTDAEEYLSWLAVERGRSPNTLAAYRRDLRAYEAALAETGHTPVDVGPGDVEGYLAAARASGRSAASVARAASVLRGLHRFLLDEHRSEADPTADLESGRVPLRLPKALTEAQVNRLLDAVTGTDALARRDRALLELLYGTGARISEAVGLDLTDLAEVIGPVGEVIGPVGDRGDPGGGGPGSGETGSGETGSGETGGGGRTGALLRLYGKGSKERLVPLGRCAGTALAAWLSPGGRASLEPRRWKRRGDAEAVFLNARGGRLSRQGAYDAVRKHATAVGLGSVVSPHVLRHSCATHMLAHGADIRVVQELLGHASIGTTQLYTKVSAEHLRAAYESAHPRAKRRK